MNARTHAFVAAAPATRRTSIAVLTPRHALHRPYLLGRPLTPRVRAPIKAPFPPATLPASRSAPRASATVAGSGVTRFAADAGVTVSSLALTIALEAAAVRALRQCGIQFPGSLAAMLFLLSTITLLRVLRLTGAAERVRALFSPAAAFLTRWLAVFFVPNLVMLPLAPRLPGADVAKIALVLVVGLIASLLSTAAVALALRSAAARLRAGKSAPPSPPVAATAGSVPPSNRLLLALTLTAAAALPFAAAGSSVPTVLYALCATLLAFCVGQRAPARLRAVLHPLVVCTAGALTALSALAMMRGLPLAPVLGAYYVRDAGWCIGRWGAGNALAALLGPAVVSFALQMDGRRALVRARAPELVGTSLTATLAGLFGTAAAARALQMSPPARLVLVPRMITAPLAAAIVEMLGAQPGVALSIVAITGLLGANIAAPMLTALRVKDPVVRGLATGAAAHGLGTAAMSDEPAAFPFAAIAMTLVGIFATCLVAAPPVRALLLRVALGKVLPAPAAVA